MSWLSSWLKKTKVSAGEPTCFLPTPHKNAPLLNLKEDQFICPSMLDYIAEVKLDCNIIQYCKKLQMSYEPQRLFFNKIENFYLTLPLLYVTCIMNCVHQPWCFAIKTVKSKECFISSKEKYEASQAFDNVAIHLNIW